MSKQIQIFESPFTTYRRDAQIGSGGSGTVLKVKDEDGACFAVKYLSPETFTTEKVKRFKNELTFCSRNEHPNIVRVLDWGSIEINGKKCPFYVMPYYASNLRDLMNTGIPIERILLYFSQILDGVEAAHLLNVCHRDLKPENILHDPSSGVLVVADFGIARFAESQLGTIVETRPGARMANFQYAAPEQREKGGRADYRADIYALGLILNEMFTGKIPAGVDFKRIAEVDHNSSYLDDLVDSMMRYKPEDRPNAIAAIKRELIARKNAFVAEQKISQLKNKVIPETEIDDPLVVCPPELVDVKWEEIGQLIFTLSRPVNQQWAQCFQKPKEDYSAVSGYDPSTFHISGQTITVACNPDIAQQVRDHTKRYIEMANRSYCNLVARNARELKVKKETELSRQLEMAEKTKAINAALKL